MRTGAIMYVFMRPLALEASWIAPRDPLARQVWRDFGGNTTLTHVSMGGVPEIPPQVDHPTALVGPVLADMYLRYIIYI